MKRKDRLEGEDEGGAWRERLPSWPAPPAPARLEHRLREGFRARRRTVARRMWAGRAAIVALALAAALLVRLGPGSSGVDEAARVEAPSAIALTVAVGQVRAELDLAGFEPVRHPRVTRGQEARTETNLEGFVPVQTMRLTRGNGQGGRP